MSRSYGYLRFAREPELRATKRRASPGIGSTYKIQGLLKCYAQIYQPTLNSTYYCTDPMNYACLKQQIFSHPPYQLVPLRHRDLLEIKDWRNAQMDILRQHQPLTDEAQELYYQTTILPLFTQSHPTQILFSFLLQDTCIGYGGLVHIDWFCRRSEVSFLLNTERSHDPHHYQQAFSIYLTLLKQIAFTHLKLHRLFTETFDIRPLHIAVLEANGFSPEGRLKEHVVVKGKFVDSIMHGCINHAQME